MAFAMETIDASLGMMYGTLLSPILIILGFEPILIVPAILFSQAMGGVTGSLSHQKFKNADFRGFTPDMKVALAMIIPGLLVVVFGVFAAVSLPGLWVKTYIGILVVIMSALCLSPIIYKFAWWKHYLVGMLAAFNKALTGGGFGPVTSTGGILGGLESRVSIATTTLAEVVICFASFAAYMALSGRLDDFMLYALTIGAVIGGVVGPYFCSRASHHKLRVMIGLLGVVSGIWLMVDVVFKL
ncbi:MAG: sulfite exporter TauE/SafE family protein [Candidatus Thermoplasmatota archaeon]|nr:sulfite exporter TauE/SafE family protein [Candidatus Thermoplasmatota archaeon]